ncbi:MAG: SusC/RagA family TonB-linked outer membrane protein, partial [Daejeonella sp.]
MKKILNIISKISISIFILVIQLSSLHMLIAAPVMDKNINEPGVIPGIIRAQVKDIQTSESLIGVTVFVKGSGQAPAKVQQTDSEGRFEINLQSGNYELTFKYIGYQDEKRMVQVEDGKEISLDITMKASSSSLDEVVIVGYGTKKRSSVTGAINQVGTEVFEDRPITNVAEGLQGVIPNLNITFSDGQPGRGANYNVRGFTSINGGSPLILIDGIPGDINLINPEDIQNVTVLKDASSAAIYGARASFGVILVTTKSGKKGKLDVRYSNNFGTKQPLGVPEVVDARTNAEIQNEIYKGFSGQDQTGLIAIIDYLKQRQANPSLPELGVDASGKFIRGADINWYDAFYTKNQAFQKHTLSIAGGSDKINYYLSAGTLYQEGTFRVATDNYTRYNLRGKLDFQIKPWLSVFNNSEFSQGRYDAPNKFVSSGFNIYRYLSLAANPYESIKTPDGNWTTMGSFTFGQLEDAGRTQTTNRVIRNTIGFRTSFLNNSLRLNGDYTAFYNQDLNNIQNVPVPYETAPGVIIKSNRLNYVQSSFKENVYSIANLYAEYEKALGRHQINFLAGANQELNRDRYFFAKRYDNITSELNSLNLATGILDVGDNKATWALQSLFYRA